MKKIIEAIAEFLLIFGTILALIFAFGFAQVLYAAPSAGVLYHVPIKSDSEAVCWNECSLQYSPFHPFVRYQHEHWSVIVSQPMKAVTLGREYGGVWAGPGVYQMSLRNPVGKGTLSSVGVGWQAYYQRGHFTLGLHIPHEERYSEIDLDGAGWAEVQRVVLTLGWSL